MEPVSEVSIFDATIKLTDEYTNLVTREKAKMLVDSLVTCLRGLPDEGILVLDFSSVISVDHSFLDEFLIPILKDIQAGNFGARLIAGVNFNQAMLVAGIFDEDLSKAAKPFLVLDTQEKPLWLGISDPLERQLVEQIYSAKTETTEHLQVLFGLDKKNLLSVLDHLIKKRLIRQTVKSSIGVNNFIPSLDIDKTLVPVARSIAKEFEERVYQAVEKGCHYEVSSDVHASEYLHLSKVFSDARLLAKIAVKAGQFYWEQPPNIVLTVCTPSALAFGQRLSDYFGTSLLFANIDSRSVAHLSPGLHLPTNKTILIAVDVLSTGGDVKALLELVRPNADKVIGICAVVDVSGGIVKFHPFPMHSVLTINLAQFQPWQCPMCKAGVPLKKAVGAHLEFAL